MAKQMLFSTSDVAAICKVSSRTVEKWFDSGKLRGYRIPGSQLRRIPRDRLISFLVVIGGAQLLEEYDARAEASP